MMLRLRTILLPGILAIGAGSASAADSSEVWPEASLFAGLSRGARAYLDASYARGKESNVESLDLTAFLDVSLKPIARRKLLSDDWQRARYLWTRCGYTHVERVSEGDRLASEERGVVSIYGRVPLPVEIWIETRVRADLRWIGGDYSTRYRFRTEGTREFAVVGKAVVPYLNIEWFYDTRYYENTRTLVMAGGEVTFTTHFRAEAYLAWQDDTYPSDETLNALGLVAKFYY